MFFQTKSIRSVTKKLLRAENSQFTKTRRRCASVVTRITTRTFLVSSNIISVIKKSTTKSFVSINTNETSLSSMQSQQRIQKKTFRRRLASKAEKKSKNSKFDFDKRMN